MLQKTSSEVKQKESVKNDLLRKLEAEKEVLQNNEQQKLQNTIDVVTNRVKSLNRSSNDAGNCSTTNNGVTFRE
jgi:predicted house-cleaning noncanonical NTP pyrophosphatase (MazG superfamily)